MDTVIKAFNADKVLLGFVKMPENWRTENWVGCSSLSQLVTLELQPLVPSCCMSSRLPLALIQGQLQQQESHRVSPGRWSDAAVDCIMRLQVWVQRQGACCRACAQVRQQQRQQLGLRQPGYLCLE
jgi:hypothetical protein